MVKPKASRGRPKKAKPKPSPKNDESDGVDDIDDCIDESEKLYEVEAITGTAIIKRKKCFLVKWKGWSEKDSTWEPEENLATSRELVEEFLASQENTNGDVPPLTQSESSESESEPSGSEVQSGQSEEAQSQPPPEPAVQIPTGLPTPSPSPSTSSSVNAANSANGILASGSSTPLPASANGKRPGPKSKTLPGAVPSTSDSSAINQFSDVQASTSKPAAAMSTPTPPSEPVRRPGPKSKTLPTPAVPVPGPAPVASTSTSASTNNTNGVQAHVLTSESLPGPSQSSSSLPAPPSSSTSTSTSVLTSATDDMEVDTLATPPISGPGSSEPKKRPGPKSKTLPGAVPSTSDSSAINQFSDVQASTSKPAAAMSTPTPPSEPVRRPGPKSKTLPTPAVPVPGPAPVASTSTSASTNNTNGVQAHVLTSESLPGPSQSSSSLPAPPSSSTSTSTSVLTSATDDMEVDTLATPPISGPGSSEPKKRPGPKSKTLPAPIPAPAPAQIPNSIPLNATTGNGDSASASESESETKKVTALPPIPIRRPGPKSKTLPAATSTGGDMPLLFPSTADDSDEEMPWPEPVPAPAPISAPVSPPVSVPVSAPVSAPAPVFTLAPYSVSSSAGTMAQKVRPGPKSKSRKASPSPAPPTSSDESSADDQDRPGTARGRAGMRKRRGPGPKSKNSRGRGRSKKAKNTKNTPPGKGKKLSDIQVFSGPGHSLNSASPSVSSPLSSSNASSSFPVRIRRTPPSDLPDEKRQAAAAALSRYEKEKATVITDPQVLKARRHLEFIKAQAMREIKEEREQMDARNQNESGQNDQMEAPEDFNIRSGPAEVGNSKSCATGGVHFTCSLLGTQVLPLHEIENEILQFLCDRPKDEMGQTACSLIHSCNKDKNKVAACVETLCMYLGNIIDNPTETKYHKIRVNNNVFQTKVTEMVGVPQFLTAAGFSKTNHKGPSGEFEEYYEFHLDGISISMLPVLRDTLKSTQPILPEVCRDVKVLMPAQLVETRELPPEFFSLTPKEIQREQKRRTEIAERALTLRTKATRDQDEIELTEQRLYRYALIRIRFPDGFTLQGTFRSNEKVGDLYSFVTENLANPRIDFTLVKSGGEVLSNHEATLASYDLPPASIVNFRVDSAGPSSQSSAGSGVTYLKPEVLILVQNQRPSPEVSKSDGEGKESSDEEWEVEEIVDSRILEDETKEYCVKWKGWASSENTWEPEENLENSQELITRYMERYMTFKVIKK